MHADHLTPRLATGSGVECQPIRRILRLRGGLHQARLPDPIGSLVLTIYDENRLQVLDNLKKIDPNARTPAVLMKDIGNIANLQPPRIVHLFAKWSELLQAAWAYRNARDAYTRAANRMRVACEAVVLLRSGCDAGGLVSAVLELAT